MSTLLDQRVTSYDVMTDPSRRRVTRKQLSIVKTLFPFLSLPAELRNLIYLYCISFDGVGQYLTEYYHILKATPKKERSTASLRVQRTTPTVLLINKQIFSEAFSLICKNHVEFNHGLLRRSLNSVITENPLRQLSSIEINDVGHPLMDPDMLAISWHGTTRLITELAAVLAKGHRLKNFVLSLKDDRLKEHMTTCFHGDYNCGFRDQLRDAVNELRKVRGVESVTIEGVNDQLALQVKHRMQSQPVTWKHIPQEVKDIICSYAVPDWSEISKSIVRAMANFSDHRKKFPYPERTTPTILLLDKEISNKALALLRQKTLNIDLPGDHNIPTSRIPKLIKFISPDTLAHVKTLNLRIESWEWLSSIKDTVRRGSATKSSFCDSFTSIENLHIEIKDGEKSKFLEMPRQRYPDVRLHSAFKLFKTWRGLKEVGFSGDLPPCYVEPLAQMMRTTTPEELLPPLMAQRPSGAVVSIDDYE